MTQKRMRLPGGVELSGENIEGIGGNDLTRNGEIATDSSDNELKVRLDGATRTVVTENQTQVLTNKTIDADLNTILDLEVDNLKSGVLNVSTTLSGASDTQLPSALAVKTYIDDKADAQNEASEISYDPTASGLAGTNVQDAIDEVEGMIESHILDSSDAHDASAISNTPTGNLAATDVQGALNELQGDIDTNTSGLSNHISDTVDAHDASAISVAAIIGVTGDDVQEALEDLKDQIDTKGTGNGDVAGPASSTDNAIARFDSTTGKILQDSVVTVSDTGVIAGSSIDADTNTITNIKNSDIKAGAAIDASKIADGSVSSTEFQYLSTVTSNIQTQLDAKVDETGGTIISPARLDAKQDTLANLYTYALTATDGQFVWATDTKETYVVKDSTLSSVGGGSGSLDTVLQLTASEQLSDWSTGKNATFLGGGTLDGTFAKNTSTPLHGSASYIYTQGASSLNDYFSSKVFPVDIRFRGQPTFLSFPYQYNGNNSDIDIIVYDVTNTSILTFSTDDVIGTNGSTSGLITRVTIPINCTQIRVGFQVKTANSGKVFSFDDLNLSTTLNSAANISSTIVDYFEGRTRTNPMYGSTNQSTLYYPVHAKSSNGVIESISNTVDGTSFRALQKCVLNITASQNLTLVGNVVVVTKNSTNFTTGYNNAVSYVNSVAANYDFSVSASINMEAGDIVRVQSNLTAPSGETVIICVVATAQSSNVALPTDQISSDTIPFAFKATAIVDSDPIGTFNTYTYASSTNTQTLSTSAPTQTITSMNVDGIQIFPRAYNAASTEASPAKVDIFIGMGLKSKQVDAYVSSAKVNNVFYDCVYDAAGSEYGTAVSYNATTGILSIDLGRAHSGAVVARYSGYDSTGAAVSSGTYFVFNASKSPSIVALPILTPRIATLSDIKASGIGGASLATTFNTRTLNTIVDPTSIVTSLVSNEFTLPAGAYYIEASAPALALEDHMVRIRNITDGITSLYGTSEYTKSSAFVGNRSFVSGEIIITSSKTFSLQHFTAGAFSSGLGEATGSGEPTTFAIVKITKIK
jgi:hypothetical protein